MHMGDMNSIPNQFRNKLATYGNLFRLLTVKDKSREYPNDSLAVTALDEAVTLRLLAQVAEENIPQKEDVSLNWILYNCPIIK